MSHPSKDPSWSNTTKTFTTDSQSVRSTKLKETALATLLTTTDAMEGAIEGNGKQKVQKDLMI